MYQSSRKCQLLIEYICRQTRRTPKPTIPCRHGWRHQWALPSHGGGPALKDPQAVRTFCCAEVAPHCHQHLSVGTLEVEALLEHIDPVLIIDGLPWHQGQKVQSQQQEVGPHPSKSDQLASPRSAVCFADQQGHGLRNLLFCCFSWSWKLDMSHSMLL